MDEQLAAIVVALIGTVGAVFVAVLTRAKPPDPLGTPPPTVAVETDRAAAGMDELVDALVEARQELRRLEGDVWVCPIESCPVRDHLREQQR